MWSKFEYLDLDVYKYLESKGKQYIYGYKDGKWNIIDLKKNEIVYELDGYSITSSSVSPMIYYRNSNSNDTILNLYTLNSMETDRYNDIKFYDGYFTIKQDKKLYYYNNDLKLIYPKE